jgi:uroporphyrin-III C-methyltransferase/precorrin-2 dehydrogenase/sirohydrochlorin ferrochelatase
VLHGLSGGTPVAIVENGTTSCQRMLYSTLAEVEVDARRAGIGAPSLLIVGEVAALGRELAWFDGGTAADAFEANSADLELHALSC